MIEARGAVMGITHLNQTRDVEGIVYHLLSVSVYSQKFVRFLKSHPSEFPRDRHFFIIETNDQDPPQEMTKGVQYCLSRKGWWLAKNWHRMRGSDKVVLHSLTNPRMLLLFSIWPAMLRRCVWAVWGGDAYFHIYLHDRWIFRIYECLRRRVIPRIPIITAAIKGDYESIAARYKVTGKYYYSIYPSDVNDICQEDIEAGIELSNHRDKPTILIGNSADPSNRHAEILASLRGAASQFKKIYVPLMYGGTKSYVDGVISVGQETLGDRFAALTRYVPSNEYAMFIRSVDILILNHHRQQGLGNVFLMLALGRTVYLRGDVTPFGYFRSLGIEVLDTRELLTMKNKYPYVQERSIRMENSRRMRAEISEDHLVKLWADVFKA